MISNVNVVKTYLEIIWQQKTLIAQVIKDVPRHIVIIKYSYGNQGCT